MLTPGSLPGRGRTRLKTGPAGINLFTLRSAMTSRWIGLFVLLGAACAPAHCPPCEVQAPHAVPCESSAPLAPPAPRPAQTPTAGATADTRTQQVIAAVVARNRSKVRACYEAERAKNPTLAGTLTVQFRLDPRGKVVDANVVRARSTLALPSLDNCALDVVRNISFPPSSRGFESQVNYPFDFKP